VNYIQRPEFDNIYAKPDEKGRVTFGLIAHLRNNQQIAKTV
jgi:hypothetical protein